MKKIALLFSLILVVPTANAFIDSQYMKTEQFLVNTGYSAEAAKMTAVTADDPYREPYVEEKNTKNFFKRFYAYMVPGSNSDIDYYNHSGNFNGIGWKDL